MEDQPHDLERTAQILTTVADDDFEAVLHGVASHDRRRCVDELTRDRISRDTTVSRLHDRVRQRIAVGVVGMEIDEHLSREDLMALDRAVDG